MTEERTIYLKMKTLKEAKQLLEECFPFSKGLAAEVVAVTDAVGRVLSAPVYAKISSPNFHAAAMDGIAVKAQISFGASESAPKTLVIGKDAHWVNTGHVMPEQTDAVIMIEHVHPVGPNQLEIEAPVFPWQNVRRMGEDIVATELVFPTNHRLTPFCIGALISAGVFEVAVWKKPSVLIQPIGSELVDHKNADIARLKPGEILESNSHMLGKMAEACGACSIRNPILRDDFELILHHIREASESEADLILMTGGSSAGSEDFARRVVEKLGEVLIHGVTMMPGKPVIAGRINQKPVFGMPGYPVSAIIAFEQLVHPMLNRMQRLPAPETEHLSVHLTKKIASKLGMEEFIRVKLGQVGEKVVATPLPRGAGCITSITEADGIIRIPNHMEGVSENTPAAAWLLRPASAIRNNIVVVGSHDNTLDTLRDMIRTKNSAVSLSSSHVGSMGGLMAVKKGLCHLAGSHLLDPKDGSYNISYIQKYLPQTPIHLVHLVQRDQGLIVKPGNPKKILNIGDLAQKEVVFINRQGGSGTRVLLDFHLSRIGLAPNDIKGYDHEEFTHMAVAAAVLSGAADAGLGIYAAAKALKLEFIPVVTESYDLVIPAEYFDTDKIQLLLEVIRSDEFKSRVLRLGGYHVEKTGELIWSRT